MIESAKMNLYSSQNGLLNYEKKSKLLKMSKIQKLEYVDKLTISYPLIQDILNKIEYCQNSMMHSSQPECLSLIGPPRAGKTTIIEQHMSKYSDIIEPEGTIRQIVYCQVPCPANIGGLVTELLRAIGDPFYNKRASIIQKTHTLYELLLKCKVKLIILDEVQHLVDRNRQTLIKESSDWFKKLIFDTKIPVIYVGLPDSLKIFIENDQLGSRVLNRYTIEAFDFYKKDFRAILKLLDESLPLSLYSGLADPDIWKRIYIATNGLIGFVKVLIKESTKLALDHNTERITMPILSNAYDQKLAQIFGDNPFTPGFDLEEHIENYLLFSKNESYCTMAGVNNKLNRKYKSE